MQAAGHGSGAGCIPPAETRRGTGRDFRVPGPLLLKLAAGKEGGSTPGSCSRTQNTRRRLAQLLVDAIYLSGHLHNRRLHRVYARAIHERAGARANLGQRPYRPPPPHQPSTLMTLLLLLADAGLGMLSSSPSHLRTPHNKAISLARHLTPPECDIGMAIIRWYARLESQNAFKATRSKWEFNKRALAWMPHGTFALPWDGIANFAATFQMWQWPNTCGSGNAHESISRQVNSWRKFQMPLKNVKKKLAQLFCLKFYYLFLLKAWS